MTISISRCHFFVKWGGHARAAGFTVETRNLPLLRERLAAAGYAGTVTKTNLATGATATARARLQSAEVLEPKQIIDNLLKVALYFEFITWF